MHNYILVNGQPVIEPNVIKWAMWFEKSTERIVEKTKVGNVEISTVFLGIDHRFGRSGPPILWETMVFGGSLDQEQERYVSLGDAKRGHFQMVERVRVAEKGTPDAKA